MASRVSAQAPFPTADQIARRAHEIFVTNGRRVSKIPEYWREAENELLERAARRVLGGKAQSAPER